MNSNLTSSIDLYGLERFRVHALIELILAGLAMGIPETDEDRTRLTDLQWQRDRLDAYIEEERDETHSI